MKNLPTNIMHISFYFKAHYIHASFKYSKIRNFFMKHLMQLFLALSAFLISTQISIAANLQVVKTLDGRAVYCQDDRDEQMMKGNKAVSVNVASFQNLTQDLADIELQIRFVKCSDASWHLDSNPTSETYTTISLDDGNEVEVTTTYEQF